MPLRVRNLYNSKDIGVCKMVGMGVVCIGQAIGILYAIGGFDTIPYFGRYPGVDGNGHCEKKSG